MKDDELFERCYRLADRWGVSPERREESARFIARAVGLAKGAAEAGNADIVTSMRLIEEFEKGSA